MSPDRAAVPGVQMRTHSKSSNEFVAKFALAGLLAPLLLAQVAAFYGRINGALPTWVGELSSIILVGTALLVALVRPAAPIIVAWLLLGLMSILHVGDLEMTSTAWLSYLNTAGGLALLPAVITLCAYLNSGLLVVAWRALLIVAALQSFGFVLNFFGEMTSRLGRDQYEGMLFGYGSYNSTIIVTSAALLAAFTCKPVGIRLALLLAPLFLAFWGESKVTYLITGLAIFGWFLVRAFFENPSRDHRQKAFSLSLGIVALVAGASLALSGLSQFNVAVNPFWTAEVTLEGTPSTGYSPPELSAVQSQDAPRSNARIPQPLEGKADVIRGIVNFRILGSVQEVLMGRGPGHGASKYALEKQQSSGRFNPGALNLRNTRGSIAAGPASTALHITTERGIAGIVLYVIALLLIIRHIWLQDRTWRMAFVTVAPSLLVLLAFTSLLETPLVAAIAGVSMASLAGLFAGKRHPDG